MQHHRQSLTDADADRGDAIAAAAALELVRERGEDARAAGAERVADGDRAAIGVDALGIDRPLVDAGERLRRERLVELDDLDVFPSDTGARERLVRGLHRRDPEDV